MTRKSTNTQVGTQVGTDTDARIARLENLLADMGAKLDAALAAAAAPTQAAPTQAQADAPKRTRKQASAPKQAQASKGKGKGKVAPVKAEPVKMTPSTLALALTGAKVGERVELTGMSKREVNQTIAGMGGTWDVKAWANNVNATYKAGGHTFTFDNTKSWKPGAQRGMTRTA